MFPADIIFSPFFQGATRLDLQPQKSVKNQVQRRVKDKDSQENILDIHLYIQKFSRVARGCTSPSSFLNLPLRHVRTCPTDPFTILELQNSSIKVSEQHKVCIIQDFEALQLRNVRSGGWLIEQSASLRGLITRKKKKKKEASHEYYKPASHTTKWRMSDAEYWRRTSLRRDQLKRGIRW